MLKIGACSSSSSIFNCSRAEYKFSLIRGFNFCLSEYARDSQYNMSTSSDTSNRLTFLRLPTEIRLKIYELLMVSDNEVRPSRPFTSGLCSQLLRLCCQIYQGAPVLCGHNVFGTYGISLGILQRRLRDHDVARITNLRFYNAAPAGAGSHFPPRVAAADAGAFKGLRIFGCGYLRGDDPEGLSRHLRDAKSCLKVLLDRPDHPNLGSLSL